MSQSALRLLRDLESLDAAGESERISIERIREFLRRAPDPFSRSTLEGHVTASAVVARPDGSQFLLLPHRKLGRWLQPGGHIEPSDASVFAAALREAREETGIDAFGFPIGEAILDADVHAIPAHGADPPHFHYDIRHLFTVEGPSKTLPGEVAWFSFTDAVAAGIDESLARALRKVSQRLSVLSPTADHPPPTA